MTTPFRTSIETILAETSATATDEKLLALIKDAYNKLQERKQANHEQLQLNQRVDALKIKPFAQVKVEKYRFYAYNDAFEHDISYDCSYIFTGHNGNVIRVIINVNGCYEHVEASRVWRVPEVCTDNFSTPELVLLLALHCEVPIETLAQYKDLLKWFLTATKITVGYDMIYGPKPLDSLGKKLRELGFYDSYYTPRFSLKSFLI